MSTVEWVLFQEKCQAADADPYNHACQAAECASGYDPRAKLRTMSEYVVGLDLGGTKIISLCLDRDLNVSGRDYRETEADEGPEAVIGRMVQSALAAARGGETRRSGRFGARPQQPRHRHRHDAAEPARLARRASRNAHSRSWASRLDRERRQRGALAEQRLGAGRGAKHCRGRRRDRHRRRLRAGWQLYGGASGAAGEVGHMQLCPAGRSAAAAAAAASKPWRPAGAQGGRASGIVVLEPDGLLARLVENGFGAGRALLGQAAAGDEPRSRRRDA